MVEQVPPSIARDVRERVHGSEPTQGQAHGIFIERIRYRWRRRELLVVSTPQTFRRHGVDILDREAMLGPLAHTLFSRNETSSFVQVQRDLKDLVHAQHFEHVIDDGRQRMQHEPPAVFAPSADGR